ncbi:mitochondrial carrier [Vararia minispora EC-137]|uniref:Mitochondrial carrier n=1 Tax=Vararia minispora EC-137 TaxID=1314806 RepID=A0ACB8QYS0_9AGAM|nr:mitochondrial carrier [Vararia minispora EC-137]
MFLVFMALGLLITVPLTGTLVRLRANFNPKGLQLDPEDGVQPHTGPVVTGFFAMMARVKRLEGWAGLYKGLMPTLLSNLFLIMFSILVFGPVMANPRNRGSYNAPATGLWGTLLYSVILMFVSLPAVIITYRSITTPHRLPWFKPVHCMRVLLTPTERRKPWILYITPGLLLTEVLHIAYVVLGIRTLRFVLLPELSGEDKPGLEDLSIPKLAIFYAIVALSTILLSPLEVVSTRLAIQRNHAAAEYNSVAQEEEGDAEEVMEFAGADEDVIGLRSEMDPYRGLIDCVQKIAREEGKGALYRGWWLTLLFVIFGAFA